MHELTGAKVSDDPTAHPVDDVVGDTVVRATFVTLRPIHCIEYDVYYVN